MPLIRNMLPKTQQQMMMIPFLYHRQTIHYVIITLFIIMNHISIVDAFFIDWNHTSVMNILYFISFLFAFGLCFILACGWNRNSCFFPTIPSFYSPQNGLYIAEYMEPDGGIGKRHVSLIFIENGENGWLILPESQYPILSPPLLVSSPSSLSSSQQKPQQEQSSSSAQQQSDQNDTTQQQQQQQQQPQYPVYDPRRLCVASGTMDLVGKLIFKEESLSTSVESSGKYNFYNHTFQGTWYATYEPPNSNNDNNKNSSSWFSNDDNASYSSTYAKNKIIRRVKYTNFHLIKRYDNGNKDKNNSDDVDNINCYSCGDFVLLPTMDRGCIDPIEMFNHQQVERAIDPIATTNSKESPPNAARRLIPITTTNNMKKSTSLKKVTIQSPKDGINNNNNEEDYVQIEHNNYNDHRRFTNTQSPEPDYVQLGNDNDDDDNICQKTMYSV